MDTMELNAEVVYLGKYMPLFGVECQSENLYGIEKINSAFRF